MSEFACLCTGVCHGNAVWITLWAYKLGIFDQVLAIGIGFAKITLC